jgi:hypothetical protein
MTAGAVYVAEVVVVLLNAPQAPAVLLAQLRDHVTPAFVESFVTVAVRDAVPLISRKAGAPEIATVRPTIVIVADADIAVSAIEVAVTVTLLVAGGVAGAV